MELDAQFFMVAIPAVLFAGISKGGFGSGAAFAAASILAVALEPGQALGIMLPLLMLMDVANLRPYWKKWSAPDAKLLILGALPGVALGAWLYTMADADVFRLPRLHMPHEGIKLLLPQMIYRLLYPCPRSTNSHVNLLTAVWCRCVLLPVLSLPCAAWLTAPHLKCARSKVHRDPHSLWPRACAGRSVTRRTRRRRTIKRRFR